MVTKRVTLHPFSTFPGQLGKNCWKFYFSPNDLCKIYGNKKGYTALVPSSFSTFPGKLWKNWLELWYTKNLTRNNFGYKEQCWFENVFWNFIDLIVFATNQFWKLYPLPHTYTYARGSRGRGFLVVIETINVNDIPQQIFRHKFFSLLSYCRSNFTGL